jgi:predicted permease
MGRFATLDRLWQDIRYAARTLRRTPGFSVVAIATLTLAVAANSAIFSVVEGIILRPLAYREPGRLVAVTQTTSGTSTQPLPVCAAHFAEWRRSSTSFERLSLLEGSSFTLTEPGEPERVTAARVSADLFATLGVTMQLGRPFVATEDSPGRDRVVILSDELWRRRFASDPHVIGQKVVSSGRSYEIVGVLPADFRFPVISQLFSLPIFAQHERPQIWQPIALSPAMLDPQEVYFDFATIGRLKPGATIAQATAELNGLQAGLARLTPGGMEFPVEIVPLQERITSGYRAGLLLIWAAVGTVLLISCANVANLLLARAARRRPEMAVRSALGASPRRIARQMIVESLVLSAVSGALGLAAAYALIRLIVMVAPGDLPRLDEIRLDYRVVFFTLGIVIVDGILFGVVPAWRSSRADPLLAMRASSRTASPGREGVRLRGLLVSAEVGICALCLIVGGLLLQSFGNVLRVQRGFEVGDIVTVDLNLSRMRYPDSAARTTFFRTTLEGIAALPGVTSVGLSNLLPLSGGVGPAMALIADGVMLPQPERPLAQVRVANPDYFRTLGIPLQEGRFFQEHDRQRRVALVSESTARRMWQSDRPLGRRLQFNDEKSPVFEVVGVVSDVRATSLTSDPSPTVYLPYWWEDALDSAFPVSLAMKSSDPTGTARQVRTLLRAQDSELPIPSFRTMEEILAGSVDQRRFQMNLVLLFAGVGLALATIGIYGVVSYSVAQRTTEIGIRMAFGSAPGSIRQLVIRQGLAPLVPGLLLGVIAALAAGRLLSPLLVDVTPGDPVTIGAVVLLLAVVGLAACYVPARRATRMSPLAALKYD